MLSPLSIQSFDLLLAKIRNILTTDRDKKGEPILIKNHSIKGLSIEPETFITIAEKIIVENFQNISFSSKELASQLNTSKSTLFRKIKKQTDLSCTEFIREVRLKNASNLLNNSSLNIYEIGISVGFNSNSYFVRSFRRKYGKTPNEYRNSYPPQQTHL